VERIAMLIDGVLAEGVDLENGITQSAALAARFGELADSSWWYQDEELPELLREVPAAVREDLDVLVPVSQFGAFLAALRRRHLEPYEAQLGARSEDGFEPLDEEAVDLEPDGGEALLGAIAGGEHEGQWAKVLWARAEEA
jgi:hypothetical protein